MEQWKNGTVEEWKDGKLDGWKALAVLSMKHCENSTNDGVPLHADAQTLIEQADGLFQSGSYADAGELYKQAVTAAEQDPGNESLVEALSMVARSHLIQDEADEGRPWIQRAEAVATPDQANDWSRFLSVRGRFEWKDRKDNAKATAIFKEMYEYCITHALHDRAIDAAHMVALTGSQEEQVEWALKGIDAAEQGGHDGWLGPLWNNLGWTYVELKQHDKALDALLKARHHHHQRSGVVQKLAADIFVGQAYRLVGNLDESEKWINEAHQRARTLWAEHPDDDDFKERLGNTHEQLGELAAARGSMREALRHLEQSKELLSSAGAEKWDPEGLRRLSDRIGELTRSGSSQ